MSRRRKIILWIATPAALVLAGLLLIRFVIYDWSAKPYCHKQMTVGLRVWLGDKGSNAYPNVNGTSLASMELAAEQLFATNQIFRDYNYVPGLREDDPPHLVLFYMNKPTRWRFHVHPEARWKDKTWIVVPIDFTGPLPGTESNSSIHSHLHGIIAYGEMSHSLSTQQFTNRLIATLEFLRTNDRPHWQAVVKEHTSFLESIHDREN
jgi:hypothetical protein